MSEINPGRGISYFPENFIGTQRSAFAVVSSLHDGHLGWGADENRSLFCENHFIDPTKIVRMKPVHGDMVALVYKSSAGTVLQNVDAVVTKDRDLALALSPADCLPIMLLNPENYERGLIHAGWQGLHLGIVENTIHTLENNLNSRAEDLQVFVGPHICQNCYEVKGDVASLFDNYPQALSNTGDRITLDLARVATDKLTALGVRPQNITDVNICTYESEDLPSFRRNGTKDRFLTLFMLSD